MRPCIQHGLFILTAMQTATPDTFVPSVQMQRFHKVCIGGAVYTIMHLALLYTMTMSVSY